MAIKHKLMGPLLSIAIPTHNRSKYAIHAIQSILAIPDRRLELVVSDTSTDGELLLCLQSSPNRLFDDKRLKYFRPAGHLDMTGNHNAAIAAATGHYVCLIGDDDTIMPEAVNAAESALEYNLDAIAPNVSANYAWPDFRSRYLGAGHSTRLYISRKIGSSAIKDTRRSLEKALNGAGQGTDGLPKIYHGIVKRKLLERMQSRSGAFFHGSSPDVSGAIGLAYCCDNFVVVDYPLTIPGASGGSNTGLSAMKMHRGRFGQDRLTRTFVTDGWIAGVPKFFSVETVWAHSALATIEKFAPLDVKRFNYAKLLAICGMLHRDYCDEIEVAKQETVRQLSISRSEFDASVRRERRTFHLNRALRLTRRLMIPTSANGRQYKAGFEDIFAAQRYLSSYLAASGNSWRSEILKKM